MSVPGTSLNASEVSGGLKYACVRFDDDNNNLYIKEIECIIDKIPNGPGKVTFQRLSPKHNEDFDKKKVYHVKWQCQKPCTIKSSHRCDPFLKANILFLGESRDAVSKKIEDGRTKFPKLHWASETTYKIPEKNTLSLDSNEQDVSLDNEKPGIFSNNSICDQLQSGEKSDDDDNTENDLLSKSKKSIKGKIVEDYRLKNLLLRRNLSAKTKRGDLQDTMGGNGDLEVDDNESLSSHGFSDLSNGAKKENQDSVPDDSRNKMPNKRKPNIQKRMPKKYKTQEKIQLNIAHKRYEELDDETIYLGLDISVDKKIWSQMYKKKPKNATIFLRELMEIIWTEEEFKNRCLKLKLTSFRYPGEERIEFEPDRMQLLKDWERIPRDRRKGNRITSGLTTGFRENFPRLNLRDNWTRLFVVDPSTEFQHSNSIGEYVKGFASPSCGALLILYPCTPSTSVRADYYIVCCYGNPCPSLWSGPKTQDKVKMTC